MKRRTVKKTIGILLLLVSNVVIIKAQTTVTLKDCIDYSLINNANAKIAAYDLNIAKKNIEQQKGLYLPQISASGSADNNLKLATQLMPAEIFGGESGTFLAMKSGTKYSVSGGLDLTQKVYDPTYIWGLKSAQINNEIQQQTGQQTNEQIAYNVVTLYYQTLVIQMQINTLKSTLSESEESLKSLQLKYDNGMAKKIDVDKIKVNYNNTKSQLQQAILNYNQSLNSLKYQMGMPVEKEIALINDSITKYYNFFENTVETNYSVNNIIDFKIQQNNLSLKEIDKKKSVAAYQPTFSFYGNYKINAARQECNFFESGQDWYTSSAIGFKLSIPIFSGFQKNYQVFQSEMNVKKAQENVWLKEQSIRVNVSNYMVQYQTALDNIKNEEVNLDLAKSVYKSAQLEYQQGVSSALDLIESESSYITAQNTYYNKLLDLYIARINLEKTKGTLMEFITNLK